MPSEGGFQGLKVTVPLRKPQKYEVMLPQIVEMAEAGSGVDLISRALGIGAEVVRDALHLHRTGKRPPPIVRAYDYANCDKWSEESRAAKRKPLA
jgi:hypothetical protein